MVGRTFKLGYGGYVNRDGRETIVLALSKPRDLGFITEVETLVLYSNDGACGVIYPSVERLIPWEEPS